MTDHADLSRRLALAIGYAPEDVRVRKSLLLGYVCDVWTRQGAIRNWWRRFDYRDPVVIWPIAEHFDCFPWKNGGTHWCAGGMRYYYGDTAAEAVARAVIGARG